MKTSHLPHWPAKHPNSFHPLTVWVLTHGTGDSWDMLLKGNCIFCLQIYFSLCSRLKANNALDKAGMSADKKKANREKWTETVKVWTVWTTSWFTEISTVYLWPLKTNSPRMCRYQHYVWTIEACCKHRNSCDRRCQSCVIQPFLIELLIMSETFPFRSFNCDRRDLGWLARFSCFSFVSPKDFWMKHRRCAD